MADHYNNIRTKPQSVLQYNKNTNPRLIWPLRQRLAKQIQKYTWFILVTISRQWSASVACDGSQTDVKNVHWKIKKENEKQEQTFCLH